MSSVWLIVAGCSAYDSTLLQHKTAPLVNTGGRSGTAGLTGGAGAGAGGASGSGGAGSDGGISTGTPDAGTRCGDGVVTGEEKCDTSIATGMPGACPTECSALAACSPRKLNNGGGCQAECVVLQASCMNGDKCCPAGCSNANDNDCSALCGDGKLEEGETCEAGTNMPCKTSAAECDDGDPCTSDMLTGSAANCNSACTHSKITMLMDGDGCCPMGANNNTDKDCTVMCGNGVVEMGEVCDGSVGCSADCKSNSLSADQMRCLMDFVKGAGTANPDQCEECSCKNCAGANQYIACRDLDAMNGNTKCNDVLVCARMNNCNGTPCYCATNAQSCVLGMFGPCETQIEAAANVAPGDYFGVTTASTMNTPGAVLYQAYQADNCRIANCKSVCR